MSRRFDECTFEEIRDLDRPHAVAILPVGAVEAHGPHLPLSTDVVMAEAMATAGAARLAAGGVRALVLPSLAYTAAPFAAAFPGTISVTPAVVTALVVDVARALTGQGFGALAIANTHLDPAHLDALAAAVSACAAERLLPVAFADLTREPWALRLGAEFRSGACHAGSFETSAVMAARPDLVREETRRGLAPNPASLAAAIRAGRRTFEESGGARAYFGSPAEATTGEGRDTIEALGAIVAESLRAPGA
jgi:creatinine amidohydrolase